MLKNNDAQQSCHRHKVARQQQQRCCTKVLVGIHQETVEAHDW